MNESIAIASSVSLWSAVSRCMQLVESITSVLSWALMLTSQSIGDFGVTISSRFDSKSLLVDCIVRNICLLKNHILHITHDSWEYVDSSLKKQLDYCNDLLTQAMQSSPRFNNNFWREIEHIKKNINAI